jgi:hypothetical protein
MGYEVYKFSNVSAYTNDVADIEVNKEDANWDEAYSNWIAGKNPTNHPAWKKGVFASTRKMES